MIDEMDRNSISNALWHKLYATNNKFEETHSQELPPAPELPVPGDTKPFLDIEKIMNPEYLRESRLTALQNAKTRLSMIPSSETNRLAYKDMKMSYYISGTLIFYCVIIIGAILIPNVTIIFDFAGAFAISALAFVFPAMFYLKGAEKFGNGSISLSRLAYLYLVLGFFNCCIGLTSIIIGIINP